MFQTMENYKLTVTLTLLISFVLTNSHAQHLRKSTFDVQCTANQYGSYRVALQFCDGKNWHVMQPGKKNAPKGSKYNPGTSCKDITSQLSLAISGIYWIKPQGKLSSKAFQVYCDLETHLGGWTLVYSYTFTNYKNMVSNDNAVTPVPSWPASAATVPVSTTPPLSESTLGAVDYSLWKAIGKDVLIKSNINHWILCHENGGSLVQKKNGPMICQNIKNVGTKCHGNAPIKLSWYSHGPSFDDSSHFYYLEGNTKGSWPTHDPCGKGQRSEIQGIANPRGAIFLR